MTQVTDNLRAFARPVTDEDCKAHETHEAPATIPEAEGESQTTHVTGGLAAMLDTVFRMVPLAKGEPVDVALARNGTRMIVICDFAESVMPALDAHMRKHQIRAPHETPEATVSQ